MDENTLESPYRPIRRVAPPDAPLPGVLAACGDETVLLVDIASVPTMLWRADSAQHVWAPREVARRRDGHDVVFDWCAQTLVGVLTSRADGGLDAGEAVTVGVSLLRGHDETMRGDPSARSGRWWLTDQGRPVFVPGDGSGVAMMTAEAARLAARACADTAVARLLTGIVDACAPDARPDMAADLEERLFEAASPTPVRAAADAPVRIADLPPAVVPPIRHRSRDERPTVDGALRGVLAGVARAGRERITDLRDHVRRRDGRTRTTRAGVEAATRARAASGRAESAESAGAATRLRRLRPLLLGITVAAVIVTVGLLWTDGEDASTAVGRSGLAGTDGRDSGQPAATSAPLAGQPSTPASDGEAGEPPSDAITGSDPLTAGTALVANAASCVASDQSCPDVAASPALLVEAATITIAELTDDYGGVAVLRGTAEDGDRYIVLEQRDGRWRIRDVLKRDGNPQ